MGESIFRDQHIVLSVGSEEKVTSKYSKHKVNHDKQTNKTKQAETEMLIGTTEAKIACSER